MTKKFYLETFTKCPRYLCFPLLTTKLRVHFAEYTLFFIIGKDPMINSRKYKFR